MFDYWLLPAIFGLMVITTFLRSIELWQIQFSGRALSFLIVFATLCLLYLMASLSVPAAVRDVIRLGLFFALVAGIFFESRDLIRHVRVKNAVIAAADEAARKAPAPKLTLKEAAETSVPVVLVAATNDKGLAVAAEPLATAEPSFDLTGAPDPVIIPTVDGAEPGGQ